MEAKREHDEIDNMIDRLRQVVPDMVDTLIPELELMTGKRAKKLPSSSELDVVIKMPERLIPIQKRIEKLKEQNPTPKTAAQMISLLNRMIRLFIPGIPRRTEAVDYVIQAVHHISDPPAIDTLPQGLDYEKKHRRLHEFVCSLIQSTDEAKLDDFLQEALTGHHLVSQFQKVFNKISLPKELQKVDAKNSMRSIEKLKTGLRIVTADWEGFINMIYGLVLLKSGDAPTWGKVRKVSLWDKVQKVLTDPLLDPLATLEWVTVRNALDHGSAFFNPNMNAIEFHDLKRQVSWEVHKAWLEGVDIHLANCAMMYTWSFVKTERGRSFEIDVNALRKMARQD